MAQFVNKFLKVIGIGGGNEAEEVYEDDYENYGEDGYTEDEAERMLYNGGLRIYATINSEMQDIIEKEYEDNSNFNVSAQRVIGNTS